MPNSYPHTDLWSFIIVTSSSVKDMANFTVSLFSSFQLLREGTVHGFLEQILDKADELHVGLIPSFFWLYNGL